MVVGTVVGVTAGVEISGVPARADPSPADVHAAAIRERASATANQIENRRRRCCMDVPQWWRAPVDDYGARWTMVHLASKMWAPKVGGEDAGQG